MIRSIALYFVLFFVLPQIALAREGDTPLHIAIGNKDYNLVISLIAEGADVNAKNERGDTLLHYAASHNAHKIVALLIDKGADVNAKNDGERTPLDWTVWGNLHEIAALLIDKGADVNAANKDGMSVLALAAEKNAQEVAVLLINKGADVNATSIRRRTPLHNAAWSNAHEILALLITRGADVNATDVNGETPLDLVGWNNAKEAKALLIAARAKEEALIATRAKEEVRIVARETARINQTSRDTEVGGSVSQCSKKDIFQMLNAGYNKNEIDDICANKTSNIVGRSVNNIKADIAKKLRFDEKFTREFLNSIKMTYSNNVVVFYDNCPQLMKLNNSRLSKEYAKKERERERKRRENKKRGVLDLSGFHSMMTGNNAFSQSFKYEEKCYAMLRRAGKLAKTVEGVKGVEILK